MQDTFIIAFKKPRDLRGETLLAYLKKIAIHECFRKRKAQQHKQSFVLFSLDDEVAEIPDADEDFLPEESLYIKERQAELIQIINTLPKTQREVTYLYYYFNFNTEQIAALYQCTSSMVRSHLHRARASIKNKLEGKNKYMRTNAATATAVIVLGALFFMEEQVFAAGYIPATACVGGTAVAASAASTVTVASIVKGCVAACLVGVGAIATVMYLTSDEPIPVAAQPAYEVIQPTPPPATTAMSIYIVPAQQPAEAAPTEAPPTEAPPTTYMPYEPAVHEEPPLPTPPPTDPPITQPPTTQPPPTQPAVTPPPATAPPTTMPPPELPPSPPPPADRTQAILASLANATTQADVAHIIAYYGFADMAEMETHSGTTFQFYVLDDGSGDILIGTATAADGTGWYMRFDLFASGQAPMDVMQRLLFMEYL